ncbi:MAG TPA: TM0106 family RecB-like putative nuclease [Gemmatimonadales bacterium]|nr:TM0106 family RecB-like putative nuclease [Gemmatimonadales bacterium]
MIRLDTGILYSPKDILAYADGEFAAWMERAAFEGVADAEPDPEDPELALLAAEGNAHEEAALERERHSGRRLHEVPKGRGALADTRTALAGGADTIYQACLERAGIRGYADFLRRTDAPSALGAWSYEPWDTKLARSVRPKHVLQLCAYCDALEEMQGVLPTRFGFILGHGREVAFRTLDYIHYYRALRDRFLQFQRSWRRDARPDPAADRGWGRWSTAALAILEARDHLSRVANISRSQVRRLEAAGITTLTALADGPSRPSSFDATIFAKLVRQARLQRTSAGRDVPLWEVVRTDVDAKPAGLDLLPPASANDVYFDMEGYPHVDGGLEYLFGAATRDGAGWTFHDWWAHDTAEERTAFEGFVDWVWDRWRADPAMHVYHYAAYETSALKRLMGKFGSREAQVDELLRHEVFVDLYTVIRQGVAVGTPSYSLKDVEHLYRERREGGVVTAAGSVVAYGEWRESGEAAEWEDSPRLRAIRDYNEDDCVSTGQLAEWLRDRQREAGIAWVPLEARRQERESRAPEAGEHPTDQLAIELERLGDDSSPPRTLAGLLQYHRREDKPMWWQLYEWSSYTHDELIEEADPLGALTRTDAEPEQVKQSTVWEYEFPEQETAIEAGKAVKLSDDLSGITVHELDPVRRRIRLKRKTGEHADPPEVVSLLPFPWVKPYPIPDAIFRFGTQVNREGWPDGGVTDLLHRHPPRLGQPAGTDLRAPSEDIVSAAIRIATSMEPGVLCLQGPPGTGKTYTAAHVIAALVREGKRVGVTGHGHKVINKVLQDTAEVLQKSGDAIPALKYSTNREEIPGVQWIRSSSAPLASVPTERAAVIGGTAWLFSRDDVVGHFDLLVIDEAGQYPLANAVGAGQAAKSLILVGDQMQLAQPRKGTHPGQSGLSALEYYLNGHATVPAHLGLFLDRTRRLHPAICGYVSEAFYEGRLEGIPGLERQQLDPPPAGASVTATHGIVHLDVPHVGNESSSPEEVDRIVALSRELVGRRWTEAGGAARALTPADILVVAPFNDQVARLEAALGPDFRVGTVDRFQGQEAAVVIVSLTSSTLDDAPRGAEFLLSPNRLNVAISRARTLAIVVGSPELERVRPTTVRQMELVNRLSWLRQVAQ